MLVPVTDLQILQGLVLGQHPQARTDYPDVFLLLQQQRQLSFLCDESLAPDAHNVSTSVWDVIAGGLDGDLQSKVFLPHIQEGGLAVLANGGDAATEGLLVGG